MEEASEGVSFQLMLDMVVQQAHRQLADMAEITSTPTQRGIELMDYLHRTRQLFLRILVIARWLNKKNVTSNAADLVMDVQQRSFALFDAASGLNQHYNTMPKAMLAPYDIPHAIDVLGCGSYTRMPRKIELMLPEPPLLKSDVDRALLWMHMQIRGRLADEQMPYGLSSVCIAQGRLVLRYSQLYELAVTIRDSSSNSPWRLLSIDILVNDTRHLESIDGPLSCKRYLSKHHIHHLQQTLNTILDLNSESPLSQCCAVAHTFCLELQKSILLSQAKFLSQTSWYSVLSPPINVDDVSFAIHFWPGFLTRLESLESEIVNDMNSELTWDQLVTSACGDDQLKLYSVAAKPLHSSIGDSSVRVLFTVSSPLYDTHLEKHTAIADGSQSSNVASTYDANFFEILISVRPILHDDPDCPIRIGSSPNVCDILSRIQECLSRRFMQAVHKLLLWHPKWHSACSLCLEGKPFPSVYGINTSVMEKLSFPTCIIAEADHRAESSLLESSSIDCRLKQEVIILSIDHRTGELVLSTLYDADIENISLAQIVANQSPQYLPLCLNTLVRSSILGTLSEHLSRDSTTILDMKSIRDLGYLSISSEDIKFSRCFVMPEYIGCAMILSVLPDISTRVFVLCCHPETQEEIAQYYPTSTSKGNLEDNIPSPKILPPVTNSKSILSCALSLAVLFPDVPQKLTWDRVCDNSSGIPYAVRIDAAVEILPTRELECIFPADSKWSGIISKSFKEKISFARYIMLTSSISRQALFISLFDSDHCLDMVDSELFLSGGVTFRIHNLIGNSAFSVLAAHLHCTTSGICRWYVKLDTSRIPEWVTALDKTSSSYGGFDWKEGIFSTICTNPALSIETLLIPWFTRTRLLGLACVLHKYTNENLSIHSFSDENLEIYLHTTNGSVMLHSKTHASSSQERCVLCIIRITWQKGQYGIHYELPETHVTKQQDRAMTMLCNCIGKKLNEKSPNWAKTFSKLSALHPIVELIHRTANTGISIAIRTLTRIFSSYYNTFLVEFKFKSKGTVILRDFAAHTSGQYKQPIPIPRFQKFFQELVSSIGILKDGKLVVSHDIVMVNSSACKYVLPINPNSLDNFSRYLAMAATMNRLNRIFVSEGISLLSSDPNESVFQIQNFAKLHVTLREFTELQVNYSGESSLNNVYQVLSSIFEKQVLKPPFSESQVLFFVYIHCLPRDKMLDILSIARPGNSESMGVCAIMPSGLAFENESSNPSALRIIRDAEKKSIKSYTVIFNIKKRLLPLYINEVTSEVSLLRLDISRCSPDRIVGYDEDKAALAVQTLKNRQYNQQLLLFNMCHDLLQDTSMQTNFLLA